MNAQKKITLYSTCTYLRKISPARVLSNHARDRCIFRIFRIRTLRSLIICIYHVDPARFTTNWLDGSNIAICEYYRAHRNDDDRRKHGDGERCS